MTKFPEHELNTSVLLSLIGQEKKKLNLKISANDLKVVRSLFLDIYQHGYNPENPFDISLLAQFMQYDEEIPDLKIRKFVTRMEEESAQNSQYYLGARIRFLNQMVEEQGKLTSLYTPIFSSMNYC